ncbi:hypothetical protein PO902_14205 [Planococcus maritimus]|nr:hypothetical protein [Planococcus sp. SK3692]MDE4086196.1 hypothetical protein [Planococcus maritimus]
MKRRRDVLPAMCQEIDFETHKERGKGWDYKMRQDFEFRKKTAESLLHQGRYGENIFKIAGIACLPVMTIREIFADYQAKKGATSCQE